MKVIFIKRHPAGIEEGREVVSSPDNCKRWIDQGYAKEVTTQEPKKRSKREPKKGKVS
tara:strand:+ start:130 stop:303 length:174 start_codon:yes stop_codon:yes gene_type:complete